MRQAAPPVPMDRRPQTTDPKVLELKLSHCNQNMLHRRRGRYGCTKGLLRGVRRLARPVNDNVFPVRFALERRPVKAQKLPPPPLPRRALGGAVGEPVLPSDAAH